MVDKNENFFFEVSRPSADCKKQRGRTNAVRPRGYEIE
jgi:hypothetical protein